MKVIVIGASAGGVSALLELAAGFQPDLQAAVLVVLHIGEHRSLMPQLMGSRCALPVAHAADGEVIKAGRILIAPPDNHMLVDDSRIRLSKGPKEHGSRPAVDPLFRTAAVAWGANVVGVVLSGMLDDGTPGLQAIKSHGGIAVVQDPEDAIESSMPRSALRFVDVDHCVPLALMPTLLASLAAQPAAAAAPGSVSNHVFAIEQRVASAQGPAMELLKKVGVPSTFTCPECHGSLWKILDSRPERYRCHTGHAFTLRTLQHALATSSDEMVWSALRALQERSIILRHMASVDDLQGTGLETGKLNEAADRMDHQVQLLRELLEEAPDPIE